MASIANVKDKSGNTIYPTTKYNAVFDSNGNTLPSTFPSDFSLDNVPTQNSNNPVKSGGIYDTIDTLKNFCFLEKTTGQGLSNADTKYKITDLSVRNYYGNCFSLNNNTITINKDISYVKITIIAKLYCQGTSNRFTLYVHKNGTEFTSHYFDFKEQWVSKCQSLTFVVPVANTNTLSFYAAVTSATSAVQENTRILLEVLK